MKHTTLLVIAILLVSLRLEAQQSTVPNHADAVYESMQHTWELLPDGGTIYTYGHSLKYLTNYAFTRAYGESFIVYDPNWQKLTVTKSVTTMADGMKVPSPFNAYNEVLPGFAANAAPYLHLREMVVTHAGLESGALVDFEYVVTTKPGGGMSSSAVGRISSQTTPSTLEVALGGLGRRSSQPHLGISEAIYSRPPHRSEGLV